MPLQGALNASCDREHILMRDQTQTLAQRMETMDIKLMLCNCKGLCDSFKDSDFNTLPFQVESDLDVKYSVLHPQLCGMGGNEVMRDILKQSAADPNTFIVVGACAPKAQEKLFKKLLRETGFDPTHFIPVDIRSADNDGILERLKSAVEPLLKPQVAAPATSSTS